MYTYPSTFARRETALKEAKYAVIGMPYESSVSYRVGSKFAPAAIRESSQEIEDYDFEEDFDLMEIKVCDLGDIEVAPGNFNETCRRVEDTIKEALNNRAIPISLGGEHTISYCAIKPMKKDFFYITFDAHLDFRDEYLNERFSHACVTRRIFEELGPERVLVIGVRSGSKEELKDASKLGLRYLSFSEYEKSPRGFVKKILKEIRDEKVYVSIDMDALDPGVAGGVCNPEPPGFSYGQLVDLLSFLKKHRLTGMDITEVTPLYDSYTQVLAAKLIFKALVMNEKKS